jgi:hypothetical protein
MKNRNKILIVLFLLVIVLLPNKANAVGICPAKTLSKYRTEALKVKVVYEIMKNEGVKTMFSFTASNLDENLEIHFNDNIYRGTKNNNKIVINGVYEDNKTYNFEIYTQDMKTCGKAYLTTKKVTIPKYNIYSESDECVEYEEFPICQKFYEGEIKDYNDFISQLSTLKKESESKVEKYEDNRTIIDKIIEWFSDNIEITVGIIAVIVLIILIFVIIKIRKIKKRVKVRI